MGWERLKKRNKHMYGSNQIKSNLAEAPIAYGMK
jgi:hypothetical protein